MCQTLTAVVQTIVCILQMIVRIFMTCVLMVENLVRLILQTFYNLLSFVAQMLSIIPICLVMVVTSKMKFLICGGGSGGGATGVSKNGTCDCAISTLMVVGVFLVFRETGVLDRLMIKVGYLPVKGLVERMKKDNVVFPKQYTIPSEWNALRTTRVKNKTTTKPAKYDWVTGVVSEETRSFTQPTQPPPPGYPVAPPPESPESHPPGYPVLPPAEFPESHPPGYPVVPPPESPESYPPGYQTAPPPVSQPALPPGYPIAPPPVSQPAPPQEYPPAPPPVPQPAPPPVLQRSHLPDSPPTPLGAPTLLPPQGAPQPPSESPPVMPVSPELQNPQDPKNITSNPTPLPAHWTSIYYYIA